MTFSISCIFSRRNASETYLKPYLSRFKPCLNMFEQVQQGFKLVQKVFQQVSQVFCPSHGMDGRTDERSSGAIILVIAVCRFQQRVYMDSYGPYQNYCTTQKRLHSGPRDPHFDLFSFFLSKIMIFLYTSTLGFSDSNSP